VNLGLRTHRRKQVKLRRALVVFKDRPVGVRVKRLLQIGDNRSNLIDVRMPVRKLDPRVRATFYGECSEPELLDLCVAECFKPSVVDTLSFLSQANTVELSASQGGKLRFERLPGSLDGFGSVLLRANDGKAQGRYLNGSWLR
jgi:hypothetical protein